MVPTILFVGVVKGGKIRGVLLQLLANQSGVDVAVGSADGNGLQVAENGMRRSKFCLVPEGERKGLDALLGGKARQQWEDRGCHCRCQVGSW